MFWVQANDNPTMDGNDVVFGFVVEGLDVVKRVCELSFDTSQEEDSGRGKPSERVRVESVTVLQ
jgi:cyclophilin family peptidyl-prolyl cis-trans isomerase